MKRFSTKTLFTALAALLLVAGCADDSPEKQLQSAKDYLQKKDTKAAAIQVKNALEKKPGLAEARFVLGKILLAEGNASAAAVEFRKAHAAKYPDSLVVPELARAMLMMGQADKLVDEFGAARLDQPAANAALQTTLAAAHGALGKPDRAQAALSAALAADPGYAPALLTGARQKAAAKDFDAALQTAEGVLAKDPGNAEAWKLKGDIVLYARNAPADALAAYRKALEADPRYLPGHIAVLTLLMRQGQLDEATKQIEKLNAIAPNNPQAAYFEAQLAYQKKDFKRARDLIQQLLRIAPGNALVLQLAGAVELQMNSLGQAEIYLTRATREGPQLALARRLLIVTHLRSGQPAKALEALNEAAGSGDVAPGMYSLAGEVHLQNGDAKKAEEYFAKALKLDPGNAGKRTALAITHLAGGQTDAAFEELESIADSDRGITADLALISAHLRRREFDKALAAIGKLEAKQPGKPLAANLRGRAQLALNDRAAARKSFERALEIDPTYFAAAASLAALDLADKKPEDAKKRFEALLAKNPKHGQALLALARLAATSDANKDEVAALVTRAVDANPTDVTPRLLLIEVYLRSKDHKQAMTAAQNAVAALPSSPELLDALGRVQQASGDLNHAIATYNKLAALQPLSPQPQLRLADAHAADKNASAAEQSLLKALEIKPDLLDAQSRLIALALQAKKYPDALKIARTVQEQRPKAAVGFLLEGDIAVAQGKWDAAAAAYRAGLQRDGSARIATKLHSILLASGKTAEADKFAAARMKDRPKDADFMAYLGELALARKDYTAAEKQYLAVLQLHPNSSIALNNLAWITGQLRKDGALAYAEKANQLAPNQPVFMDTLAMLLADKGEFAKAVELQSKALALQPANAGLRLNLARIYIKSGDKGRAKAELETLAKLGAKHPSYAEVTALLKTM